MLGFGVAFHDLSQLAPLVGAGPSGSGQVSVAVKIPFSSDDPSWSLLAGRSFGKVRSVVATLLYQVRIPRSPLNPIIGIGAGGTWYSHEGAVILKASQRYPLVVLGTTLVPPHVDVVLFLPRARRLTTTFQSRDYTIRLAGIRLGLMLRP